MSQAGAALESSMHRFGVRARHSAEAHVKKESSVDKKYIVFANLKCDDALSEWMCRAKKGSSLVSTKRLFRSDSVALMKY